MSGDPWFFHPHGGPYDVEELQRRFPEISEAVLIERRRCIASPIYLGSRHLSALWKINLFDRPSSAHREIEKAIVDQRDALYVDARATAKTTLSIEIGSVHQLLRFPNDSGLLTHSTAENAKGLSAGVRAHFTRNHELLAIFPEYAMEPGDEGNILKWSIPVRTIGGQQESIECATPGTATAGRHYDFVCCSDWMNEVTTPLYGRGSLEKMNELIAQFSQVRGMLQRREVNPRAHYRVDSNRWHLQDLAGTLIEKDTNNRIVKVLRGVTGTPGNFRPSWPEVQTPQDIQDIWESPEMTEAAFAANYRGVPLADGGIAFLDEDFIYYEQEPEVLDIGITMDCAFSDSKTESKKTDRSAIVVSGFASDRELYLLDEAAGRWNETECVDELIRMMDAWKPMWGVGIEETGSSRAIINLFQRECHRTGRYIHYREIKPGGRSKAARIAPLHFIARRWKIRVKKGRCLQTIDELKNFGVAAHDDLADAFAYRVMDQRTPPGARQGDRPRLVKVPEFMDRSSDGFLKRMERHAAEQKLLPWQRSLPRKVTRVG